MTEEFNLSEKSKLSNNIKELTVYYEKEDVKEFIKKLKDQHFCCDFLEGDVCQMCKDIDKLAGDKLI
jgi:recombinational DNA repair protein RecR